jgi:hypothetical protein
MYPPSSIRIDNLKIDCVLCPYPLVDLLYIGNAPLLDHPRMACRQPRHQQNCAFPSNHTAQAPTEAMGRSVLDYLPRLLNPDAALRVAHHRQVANYPGCPGLFPDYHQPIQPPHCCVDLYRRNQSRILPRAVGHNAGMLDLLHRNHHPALHHICTRYGDLRRMEGNRNFAVLHEI